MDHTFFTTCYRYAAESNANERAILLSTGCHLDVGWHRRKFFLPDPNGLLIPNICPPARRHAFARWPTSVGRSPESRLPARAGIDVDENAETGNIIVSYISPNSLSYGLKKGDIIISINGLRIKSLEDFIMKFNRLKMKIKQMKIYRNSKIFKVQFYNNMYIEY